MIKKFLKKYSLENKEIIYVGDEARDIVACKKNQVLSIWVNWRYDIPEVAGKENPDFIAGTPADILEIVKSEQPNLKRQED
ncbi:HAD hydrolase-like protein [Adhaeribacter arboris]|uniref:HAD hydrolase-like protein n=1 Tax=Adhaeribacter arboris TaxID=2072846 RepID=UPI0021CE9F55|nr:HAD hydrolase-like protein [Adhaeribacter arboris]